jgi:tetratricopeptide (TPR) repeat protein
MTKKDKFLAAAQKFLEKGSLDKALAEFQRAAQEDPKDTRTWLRIAEIHVKRGEGSQATQVYLKTADLYVEQGFFQRAVAVYKNVLKLTPGHTDAHFKLADVYKQLGLFSDAATQYDHAATALQKAGRLKEAMNALAQIVEMNPDQVMARVKLAELASQAGQTEEALREWGRAAEQLEAQGRIDDYLRVAERVLTLQPDNHVLNRRVAQRYMERQNPKAALAKLQVVFNALPRDVETLQLLAEAFQQLGQAQKTISVLKELVRVYEEQRQPAERQAVVARILALDPRDPIATQPLTPAAGSPAGPPRRPTMDDQSPLPRAAPADAGAARPARRRQAITFSELAIPPTLAREPSMGFLSGLEAPPDLDALDREQVAADIARIVTEADIFVKYGLTERAADHLRKVFDLEQDNVAARERLAAVLVQLGRKAEAVEELGLLAHTLTSTDPAAAERHLRRALDLDPNAEGARQMLSRLERAATPPPAAAEPEAEPEELELDESEMEPYETPRAGTPAISAFEEFSRGGATDVTPALGTALREPAAPPDDLDLGFDVGTPIPITQDRVIQPGLGEREEAFAPPPPLDPAVASELEQVDFFLAQELPDEARALLNDLPASAARHPEVLERRARLDAMAGAEPSRALPVSPLGAVPRGTQGGIPKSVTPRAVVTSAGGADAATFRDLGIAYKEMGLYDAAIAEFSKLVDDPNHEVFALTMMGECYEARGAPAEALLHYKKALNRPAVSDEEATQVYYQLGRVFHTLGDAGEALYFFEKVARRNPGFGDVSQRVSSLRAQGVAPLGHEDAARSSGAAGAAGAGTRSRR